MKRALFFFCVCFSVFSVNAQRENTDSLTSVIRNPPSDTAAVLALIRLSNFYSFVDPDTALVLADTALRFAVAIKYPFGEVMALCQKAEAIDRIGEYGAGLNIAYNALRLAQKLKVQKEKALAKVINLIAHFNALNNNDSIAIGMYREARRHYRNSGSSLEHEYYSYYQTAFSYLKLGKVDSAFYYANKGAEMPDLVDRVKNPTPLLIHGNIFLYGADSARTARSFFLKGLDKAMELETPFLTSILYFAYGRSLLNERNIDSTIFYLRKSLSISQKKPL